MPKSSFLVFGTPSWSTIRQIQVSVKANVSGEIHPAIMDALTRIDN